MHLNVDTSWYLRYRSSANPDFRRTPSGKWSNIADRPAHPVQSQNLYTAVQMQAIAYGGLPFRNDRARRRELVCALEP